MATQTQTMTSSHGPPIPKLARYSSVKKGAAAAAPASSTDISSSSPLGQRTSASQNESVMRSKSRYRKRPSRPTPASIPSLPSPHDSPKRTRQVHAESLLALTGDSRPLDEPSLRSPPRHRAAPDSRQHSDSNKSTSPRKFALAPSSSPLCPTFPADIPPRRRPLSWESFSESDAKAEQMASYSAPTNAGVPHSGPECTRPFQAHQMTSQEEDLVYKRPDTAEELRDQQRAAIEQKRRANTDCVYESREQVRREKTHSEREKARAYKGKQGSSDLGRARTIREKLRPFSSKRSEDIAPASTPKSTDRGGKPTPLKFGVAAWTDAPVAKAFTEQQAASGSAAWVDAPLSRPTLPANRPVIVPQYDAPVSAVNAGERHVLVEWKKTSVTLPVTPSTTPEDLINTAAAMIPEFDDPRNSKLVESFSQLGLQRPLRNYEHVRDVMNSWDSDVQHTFIILQTEHDQDKELNSKNAPKKRPGETSVYMYHSQRPGSWDKKWISLRSDGQVTIAKRQGYEVSNICHLSDFDIYQPTSRHQRKSIKPPKKICLAVKSLQKSTMFLDGSNFVHFFATNDRAIAAEWYRAVQGWRSWYLVDILGDGELARYGSTMKTANRPKRSSSRRAPKEPSPPFLHSPSLPHLGSNGQHPASNTASSPIRSAEPLHARKLSGRDRANPPSAFPNILGQDADPRVVKGPSPDEVESSTFAPTGLLGRKYSQRARPQQEHEGSHRQHRTDPSPALNNLLPSSPPARIALSRKPSTKTGMTHPFSLAAAPSPPAKPLIDLTPQYQEPPQHVKKGKGVSAAPGQRLVDAATGLDMEPGAIVTPSSRAWRRPDLPPSSADANFYSVDPTTSSPLGRKASTASRRAGGGRPGTATGTGTGAGSGAGVGVGVGVGASEQRSPPLLDLKMESRFVDGSLLRRVEERKLAVR